MPVRARERIGDIAKFPHDNRCGHSSWRRSLPSGELVQPNRLVGYRAGSNCGRHARRDLAESSYAVSRRYPLGYRPLSTLKSDVRCSQGYAQKRTGCIARSPSKICLTANEPVADVTGRCHAHRSRSAPEMMKMTFSQRYFAWAEGKGPWPFWRMVPWFVLLCVIILPLAALLLG